MDGGSPLSREDFDRRNMWFTAIRVKQDTAQLMRRSYYVYGTTAACFALIVFVLATHTEPSLAKSIIDACFSLLEIVNVTYLGAGVIDRTRLIDKAIGSATDDKDRDHH